MNKEKLMGDLLTLCEWLMNCSISNLVWVIFTLPSFMAGYQLLFAPSGLAVLSSLFFFSLSLFFLTLPATRSLVLFCKDWSENRLSKYTFYLKQGYAFWFKRKKIALLFSILFGNVLFYFRIAKNSAFLLPICLFIGMIALLTLFYYLVMNLSSSIDILEALSLTITRWKDSIKLLIVVLGTLFVCLFGIQYLYIVGIFTILVRFVVRVIEK
ncbi:hypothetical protein [Candidatus Enterococcus willemsii]|uniref:Integral membrane protein n=1 Tax=Candidatus Enterococcus willemsii TaxID=1857215 RepID=A0ABQ6YWR9_9ENTE|nr:hypothetical protein [Enterococcus sp. CU12B]KAF1301992.1 hypothetical protein BAU17_01075 [Enterococcus sp. CU12B]